MLTLSPAIWAGHFMLSYVTAAVWCAKLDGPGDGVWAVRVAILVYTVIALAGIGFNGWIGYRRHRFGHATLPHDFDSPEDRHRFLGFATLLLSAVSAVATLYAVLVPVFIWRCW